MFPGAVHSVPTVGTPCTTLWYCLYPVSYTHLITDPPRAGMHQDVVDVILFAEPKRIVYVSCNPATPVSYTHLFSIPSRLAIEARTSSTFKRMPSISDE